MTRARGRIALLGLYHEANTFSPVAVDMAAFEACELLRREEIVRRYDGTSATLGGMLAEANDLGLSLEPILFARATPAGRISRDAFEGLVEEMLGSLHDGGPWDGVALALHGAAVAEHIHDADGELAERVRRAVGPATPVAAVLDMHANPGSRLVRSVDLVFGYRTNPHVDAAERGKECVRALKRMTRGEIVPHQVFVQLPLMSSISKQDTNESPMADVMARVRRWDDEPDVLSVSVFEGYPYADVPDMGMSVLVADSDRGSTATRAAEDLADFVWDRRDALQGGGLPLPQALERASRVASPPALLLDVGDNIGGGAPGDSMVVWRAAREAGIRGLLQTVVDIEAGKACIAAGVGQRVRLDVGARHRHSPGDQVTVDGEVLRLSDGRYEETGTVHGGFRHFDMGPTAVIQLTEGVLVISERAVPNTSVEQFASHGIDPREHLAVIAKGVNAPRAAYRTIAGEALVVDTPGVTSVRYEEFAYANRRRPLYPFEPATRTGTADHSVLETSRSA